MTRVDDLTAGLRAGDPQALRAAYERHHQDVLSVAAAVLGRAAASEAWDVLHDVFVGLAKNAHALRVDTNLRAYLTRAAVNRARGRHRAARPAATVPDEVASATPGILEQLQRDEEAAALWRTVAELPEAQRIVVALRIWGELSFRDIAADQSISENTAQSRYRYAMEKLRTQYHGVQQ